MGKRHGGWIAVAAVAALAAAGPALAATSAPLVVTIDDIVGLPTDSLSRGEFMGAFRAEFAAGELPCEKRVDERWSSSGERRSHFQLVDAASPDEAWTLHLSV